MGSTRPKLTRLEYQWTRDFGLAIYEWWQYEVRTRFEQYFGVGFSDYPAVHNGKAATFYSLAGEENQVRDAILQIYKENPSRLPEMIEDFLHETAITRKILKKVGQRITKDEQPSLLLERHWLLFPALRLSNRIPSTWKKWFMGSRGGRKLMARAYLARKESDGIFEEIDMLLRQRGAALLKRHGIRGDGRFLRLTELVALNNGTVPPLKEFNRRSRGYVAARGQVIATTQPEKTLRQFGYLLPREVKHRADMVSGTVAFSGKPLIGRVRIVMNIDQVAALRLGEILVSSMTVPLFVPAMKRAAAIITDEGGLTCHAAIVARELKKPCIIGTQSATSVLKTGDRVEVDAAKGVVKKI